MRTIPRGLVLIVLFGLMALPVLAAEIITEEDLKQNIIREEHLVRVADNALFLFDGSASMRKPFMDTGKSRYEAVVDEFKARNAYMPSLGHKFGFYLYTPWTEIYQHPQRYWRRNRQRISSISSVLHLR